MAVLLLRGQFNSKTSTGGYSEVPLDPFNLSQVEPSAA